jgi:potassium efflux system protein
MMRYVGSNHSSKGKNPVSVVVLSPSFLDECPGADLVVAPKQNWLKGVRFEKRVGQKFLIIALLFTFFVLSVPVGQAQTPAKKKAGQAPSQTVQPQVPATSSTPPPPNQAIPLPQVADRAEDLDRLLQEVASQLTSTASQLPSESAAKAQDEEIRDRLLQVNQLLDGKPNMLELRDEDVYWLTLSQQYAAQRKNLKGRAADLEDQTRQLNEQEVQWQTTLDQNHDTTGIKAVVDRIRQKLDAIRFIKKQVKDQLSLVLNLQNTVSQRDKQIADVQTRLGEAQERLRGSLFERDNHPLWEPRELRKTDQSMSMLFRRPLDREFTSTGGYLRAKKGRIFAVLCLFVLGLMAAFWLKRYVRDGTRPGVSPEAVEIFARPFTIALLLAMLGIIGQVATVPSEVAFVVYLLCLILTLRLLPPLLEPGLRPFLYTLAAFNLLEGVRILTPFHPVLKREISVIAVLAAIVIFVWLARPSQLSKLQISGRSRIALRVAFRVGVFLLAASLAANILGYVSLSLVLRRGTLIGAFIAAAFYSTARILTLILIIALRSDQGRAFTGGHRETIERWGERILALGALLMWLRSELYMFTIYDDVMGAVTKSLQFPIGLGKFQFSIGGALSVILILVLGFTLAKFLTFALEKTVLLRLPLKPGLPYAISKFTYYILLVLIIFAAMTSAEVPFDKFTVVTGAVGVGLGFGLQNIVNNFVSGLILLFERPIRVGDTIDIGGMAGTVRRIGARSSTVETFQAAEVIVPNSNLISNQVINWTLSSSWRRVEVPVGVAYGTDPEQVLKLLVEVAKSNSGVMLNPEPMAFFLGFGESALNFELRFWSARQETWFQLKSDVAIAIAKALREAGMEIPFPQRDLHVRSIDGLAKETLTGDIAPSNSSAPARESEFTSLHPPGSEGMKKL